MQDVKHDICSATKSIAWMALAHAAKEGKLSSETKVADCYPNLKPFKAGDPQYQLKFFKGLANFVSKHLG